MPNWAAPMLYPPWVSGRHRSRSSEQTVTDSPGMQLVKPQVSVGIGSVGLLGADRLVDVAMVLVAPDGLAALFHARAVEELAGGIVDVRDERVRVEDGKVRGRVAFGDQRLKGRLVLEHVVDGRGELVHRLGDRSVVGRLVGPVLVGADAVQRRVGVQRRQVQGRRVHQHERPRPARVQHVEHVVHARRVVRQRLAADLRVRQERVHAQVIRADPQRVRRVVGRELGREELSCRRRVDARCRQVRHEGRHFIFQHRWERGVNCREPSSPVSCHRGTYKMEETK